MLISVYNLSYYNDPCSQTIVLAASFQKANTAPYLCHVELHAVVYPSFVVFCKQ